MQPEVEKLFEHKLLLITGKGGIGKTLISACLGQYAALHGKKVCVIEHASEDQLAPLFGLDAVGHKLTKFSDNLYGINLNSRDNFRDFVVKHLGHEALFTKIFSQNLVKSLIDMLPGIAELTLLGRLYYTAEVALDSFDLVIFDGYSSGHFYNLMRTPEAIMNSGLVGPVLKETQRVMSFLKDPQKCATLMVTTPEPLVMSECLDFIPRLEATNLTKIAAVMVNRVFGTDAIDDQAENILKQNPDLKPAIAYLQRKIRLYDDPERLFDKLTKMYSLPVISLPELGAVREPLPADFSTCFLEGEQGG